MSSNDEFTRKPTNASVKVDGSEFEGRQQHLTPGMCLNTPWRPPSPESEARLKNYENNMKDIVNEAEPVSAGANWTSLGFFKAGEMETVANYEDKTQSEPDFVFRIHTAVVGENVRHRLFSHDGTIEEDCGLEGIESLLEKHLGGDNGPFHTDYALHFYRTTFELMQGNYILVADIDDESDVINMRILRPGQEELRYPNRFIFFESSAWWNAPE